MEDAPLGMYANFEQANFSQSINANYAGSNYTQPFLDAVWHQGKMEMWCAGMGVGMLALNVQ